MAHKFIQQMKENGFVMDNKTESPKAETRHGIRVQKGSVRRPYRFPVIDEYMKERPFVLEHFLSVAGDVANHVGKDEGRLIDEVLGIVDGRTVCFAHRHYEQFTEEAIKRDAMEFGLAVDSQDFADEDRFQVLCGKVASRRQDLCLEMSELKWIYAPHIVSLASEYVCHGVSMESLVVAGLAAFGNAVKRFDTDSGVDLLAFARPQMREVMQTTHDRHLPKSFAV